jgi:hypothetical protein
MQRSSARIHEPTDRAVVEWNENNLFDTLDVALPGPWPPHPRGRRRNVGRLPVHPCPSTKGPGRGTCPDPVRLVTVSLASTNGQLACPDGTPVSFPDQLCHCKRIWGTSAGVFCRRLPTGPSGRPTGGGCPFVDGWYRPATCSDRVLALALQRGRCRIGTCNVNVTP